MNVSAVKPFQNEYTISAGSIRNNTAKENSLKEINELPKNSLSEISGRYQVSFSGTNRFSGPVFEHDCSEILGNKEHIEYNKEDGSFIHIINGKDGLLKRSEEFYPLEGKEVITRVIGNNVEVTTTIKGAGVKKELFDENDRQIQLKIIDEKNGITRIVDTDYDRKRRVTTEIKSGIKQVSVVDLAANTRVYSGELVKDRKYDENTGAYVTTNIITGQVLKVEKYGSNKRLLSQEEYFEGSGVLSRKIRYDARRAKYTDISYFESGARKSYSTISKNNDEEFIVEYYPDGKTEKTRTLNLYDRSGNMTGQTIYKPGTSIIKECVYYNEEDVKIYFYKENPNVAVKAETRAGNKLLSETFFYEGNDERISRERIYNEDGSYEDVCYTPEGINNETYFYTARGELLSAVEFDSLTGEKIRYVEINPQTKEIKETEYDKYTGNISRINFFSKNKKLRETITFHADGYTPRIRKEYNNDGSYTETKYDEFGNIVKKGVFNADGTPKTERHERKRTVNNEDYDLTDDEFLNKISGIVAQLRGQGELTDAQYARFAKIIDINDFEKVKHMDKTTYRNLAKKYRETDNLIFSIINNIYHSPKNDRQGL